MQLLIPAAGAGTRLGGQRPKALVDLAGQPLLIRTLRRFGGIRLVEDAVIVAPPGSVSNFEDAIARWLPGTGVTVVAGGAERQDSVSKGLDALNPTTRLVVIHDAARPFVDEATIRRVIEAAEKCGASTAAIPCSDTILEVDADRGLVTTPDRERLWACQTPQVFTVDLIREAHRAAHESGLTATDDTQLVRAGGARVEVVEGTRDNIKITTEADLAFAHHRLEAHAQ